MYQQALSKIIGGNDLSETEMSALMLDILSDKSSDAQIGALMAALATKGETYAELVGAAQAMRKKAHRIQITAPVVMDTVGTGG